MDEDIWTDDQSGHDVAAVGGPVGSDPSASSDGFMPSPRLRARIEKLAKWRIKPASITLENGSEDYGGSAAVSRGTFHKEEAEFLAQFDHKNIVKLEGFVEGVSKGIIWLVLPWAGYGNLKDFIAREKWDIPERISLISDVAKGLEYLHNQNPPICHGDLKSLNVLINKDFDDYEGWIRYRFGRRKTYAQITDFGSARRLPQRDRDPDTQVEDVVTQLPSAQSPSAAFTASTKTITLTGNKYTLRWAAPELLLQDQLSLWSDIWALGWICYEVMTGSLPFEDVPSEMAVVTRVLEGQLPSLTDNAHLSLIHELCSLMNRCWEVKPSQRPTADFCRRSIEKMPMFAPEMKDDQRALDCTHLRQLGQMYQSRNEYARAFTFFIKAATGQFQVGHRIQGLRDLAQLARLRKEYSETIAVFDVIWEVYERSNRKDTSGLGDAFCDLAELHRLKEESEESRELKYEGHKLQARQHIAKALRAMAENHRHEGDHAKAMQLNSNALKISKDISDGNGIGDALWGLAEAHRLRSEYEQAIRLYSEVLEIRTDLGDRKGRADALWGVAEVHRLRGEYDKAILLYPEVLKTATDTGNVRIRANALWGLAEVHWLRGEYNRAILLYSEVLKTATDTGNIRMRANALWRLAEVHRLRDEYDKAIPLYSEVLNISTDPSETTKRVDALWSVSENHRLRGEYDKAALLDSEVLRIATDIGNKRMSANALWGLAEIHRLRDEYDKAIPLYSQALKIPTDPSETMKRGDALWSVSESHRLRGEYDKAVLLDSEVLKIATDIGNERMSANALWGLAEIHRLRDEYDKAIPLYSQALNIPTDPTETKERVDALYSISERLRLRSEYDKAVLFDSEVLKIATDIGNERMRANALWGLAEIHRLRDEYDKALPLYAEVFNIPTNPYDTQKRADAMWSVADAHRLRGEYGKAIPLYSEVLEIPSSPWEKHERTDALWRVADMHRLRDEYDRAIPLYSEVLKILTKPWDAQKRADVLWGLAEAHRHQDEYDKAIPLYYKALGIWTDTHNRKGKAAALLGLADINHDQRDVHDDLYQQVAQILEPSRRLADPTSDDERLVRLRIRVLNWLVGRVGSLASDLTEGLPTEAGSEAWVSVQQAHIHEGPSETRIRGGELLPTLAFRD